MELMFSKSSFVEEGSFSAVPICFPDVSAPVNPDDSFITCLSLSPDRLSVYGGTGGGQAHIIGASLKSDKGYVIDMGTVNGMNRAVAITAGNRTVTGCFNGPGCACIVKVRLASGHSIGTNNGIQEWHFSRYTIQPVLELPDETILAAEVSLLFRHLVVLTDRRLLFYSLDSGILKDRLPDRKLTHLFATQAHQFFVMSEQNELFEFLPDTMELKNLNLTAPELVRIDKIQVIGNQTALVASRFGAIYRLNLKTAEMRYFSATPIAPVKIIAPVAGKYCFIFYGDGIGRFGRINLNDGGFRDLGCVASVLSTRRYGYDFACSAVGRDGEIYLGENDRGGHLWVYYPSISLFLHD